MNDDERRTWVLNDDGLYLEQQRSGLDTRQFIKKNRKMIDEVMENITSGQQPQHYLAYQHDATCQCAGCKRKRYANSSI